MNDFEEYFQAGEPGRRERAEAWATAIGLQQVDGLVPSQFLFNTAIDHIEGRITQNQARRRIRDYYAAPTTPTTSAASSATGATWKRSSAICSSAKTTK